MGRPRSRSRSAMVGIALLHAICNAAPDSVGALELHRRARSRWRSSRWGMEPGGFGSRNRPRCAVAGRRVVLFVDIVSTGLTLSYVVRWLRRRGATSVDVCTLLDRESARIVHVPIKYVGFPAPSEIVVGFGLSLYREFRGVGPSGDAAARPSWGYAPCGPRPSSIAAADRGAVSHSAVITVGTIIAPRTTFVHSSGTWPFAEDRQRQTKREHERRSRLNSIANARPVDVSRRWTWRRNRCSSSISFVRFGTSRACLASCSCNATIMGMKGQKWPKSTAILCL